VKEIEKRVSQGLDIIGREEKYIKVELDESYPKYIRDNEDFFEQWIA